MYLDDKIAKGLYEPKWMVGLDFTTPAAAAQRLAISTALHERGRCISFPSDFSTREEYLLSRAHATAWCIASLQFALGYTLSRKKCGVGA
jgi:hypothetical protein